MNRNIIKEMSSIDKRIIVLYDNNSFIYFCLENNRISKFRIEKKDSINVGDILICKIDKIKNSLEGYFVKLNNSTNGLLFFDEIKKPIVLNRKFDSSDKLKPGDEVIVRITKAAYDNKIASVSTVLEISSRYWIISYQNKLSLNFSKKLANDYKDYIKDNIIKSNILINNCAYTLRTAAKDVNLDTLIEDAKNINSILNNIIDFSSHKIPFSILYKDNTFMDKIIADSYIDENCKIITDNSDCYDFLKMKLKKHENLINKLEFYKDENLKLSVLYGLKKNFEKIISEKVWLENGGYIFITATPAMHVIDVNIGKAEYKEDKENSCLKLNLEALDEIIYQIGVRNLSGIIIIDFINLKKEESKTILINAIKKHSKDISPGINYVSLTKLGLVEITRAKSNQDIYENIKMFNKNILL